MFTKWDKCDKTWEQLQTSHLRKVWKEINKLGRANSKSTLEEILLKNGESLIETDKSLQKWELY